MESQNQTPETTKQPNKKLLLLTLFLLIVLTYCNRKTIEPYIKNLAYTLSQNPEDFEDDIARDKRIINKLNSLPTKSLPKGTNENIEKYLEGLIDHEWYHEQYVRDQRILTDYFTNDSKSLPDNSYKIGIMLHDLLREGEDEEYKGVDSIFAIFPQENTLYKIGERGYAHESLFPLPFTILTSTEPGHIYNIKQTENDCFESTQHEYGPFTDHKGNQTIIPDRKIIERLMNEKDGEIGIEDNKNWRIYKESNYIYKYDDGSETDPGTKITYIYNNDKDPKDPKNGKNFNIFLENGEYKDYHISVW